MNATTMLGLDRMKELPDKKCEKCGAKLLKAYKAREDKAYHQDHKCQEKKNN